MSKIRAEWADEYLHKLIQIFKLKNQLESYEINIFLAFKKIT